MEEVEIAPHSPLVGKSLRDLDLPNTKGIFVVAIKSKDKPTFELNPNSQTIVQENDVLIVLGKVNQILDFQKLVS